jgi:hypothetical protein
MKRFRIGNDIKIQWDVMKGGEELNLSGKSVTLYMTHARGREVLLDQVSDLSGNRVTFTLDGLKQTVLGRYTLTIDVRDGGSRVLIQDKCGAFELVGRSCVEVPEETDYIVIL